MMKLIPILLAALVATTLATPASAAGGSCPTDNADLDIGGVFYMHVASGGDHDGETFFYIDTNGIDGLQYGAAHQVFGWSEMDGIRSPCKDGDTLVL